MKIFLTILNKSRNLIICSLVLMFTLVAGSAVASLTFSSTAITGSDNIVITGGTATTSDLTLQTTSGGGVTGADMHFLVGNNGATEAMTILNNGFVGIGTTNPLVTFHIVNTNVDSSVIVDHYGDGRIPLFQRGINGTPSSPTATLSGDLLGGILVGGHNGTALTGGRARIAVVAAQNWTSGAQGTYISFSTNQIDLSQPNGTERMRITDAGTLAIGTTTPNANAILDVTSTTKAFMPPRMTTAQRDAIPSPTAGMVIYNSTTNKLNVYTTTWEAVTSS